MASVDRSDAVEDYAKAIYVLQRRGGGRTVSTTDLAERLRVTAGSTSAMVKKLAERGLVEHAPYHGVRLTADGVRLALKVLDRQPFDGPLNVRVGNHPQTFGGPLAAAVRVELDT